MKSKKAKLSNSSPILPELVILAGGKGTRFGGIKQAALLKDGNSHSLLNYAIFDAKVSGFQKIWIISPSPVPQILKERVENQKKQIEIEFVEQKTTLLPQVPNMERKTPWGTAQALWCIAEKMIAPFAVINADDFYGREAFYLMFEKLSSLCCSTNKAFLISYPLQKTLSPSGSVNRALCQIEGKYLKKIEEHEKILKKGEDIFGTYSKKCKTLSPNAPVSMNFWGFSPVIFSYLEKFLSQFIIEHREDLEREEMYLPEMINQLLKKERIVCQVLPTNSSCLGITYLEDLERVSDHINNLVKSGIYPFSF